MARVPLATLVAHTLFSPIPGPKRLLRKRAQVSFSAAKTFCDIDVEYITNISNGATVRYGSNRQLVTLGYQVS